MELLSSKECESLVGYALTPALILAWLMVLAGVAGIYKALKSASGRITISGMTFQWRK